MSSKLVHEIVVMGLTLAILISLAKIFDGF